MSTPLRVLFLEDEQDDVHLLALELRRAGFEPEGIRVETEEEFLAHLDPSLDIVLSDFTIPGFGGLHALRLMKERGLDLPFIFVSGTIGEEVAVAAMQEGASDYLLKDRLSRLGSAVRQALRRKQLQEEKDLAEQTTARLAAIVDSSSDAIIATTLDGTIVSWNRAAERLYGHQAAEILGQHIDALVPVGRRRSDAPEDHEDMAQRLRNGEQIEPYETVRVRKDRRRVDVLVSISPILDPQGTVLGASFIARDISERKRAERFLAAEHAVTRILAESHTLEEASPELLRHLAECLRWEAVVLWQVDRTTGVLRRVHTWHSTWASESFLKALGEEATLEPGVGIAGRAWTTGEPVWEPRVFSSGSASGTAQDGLRGAFGLPMRVGSQMVGVIEFYNPELRQPDAPLLAAMENIASQISQFSERRQSEADVRASEARFHQLADAMPQIVWSASADGRIDYYNARWCEFTGLPPGQDGTATWQFLLHPEDAPRCLEGWSTSVRTGVPFEMECRVLDLRSTQYCWHLARALAVRDQAGTITRWYGTFTDIDDQKQAQESLRASEERFRKLIFALPAAMYTTDREGRITLFNEEAIKLWGRRPEIGKEKWWGSWRIFRPNGKPMPLDECPMAVTLREGRSVRGEEIIIERPDGTRSSVLPYPDLLRNAQGEMVEAVNMLLDLTPMKELEAQLRQAQKMEAIGQLASGVAHDFNNLLTIINGYSEIALTELPAGHRLRAMLTEIRKAGERAAGLTRQLLAFSRKQMLQPIVLDLNGLITETEKMVRRLVGEDVEIATDLEPGLAQVMADPGQIEQVMLNLVVNARDAMPTGGDLTIVTRNVTREAAPAQDLGEVQLGACVLLSVRDTGCGMDVATKTRIFEPFFTTKEPGKGTGLGLATVYGIVKQSGGHIEVETTPGAGTTFNIYFPRVEGLGHRAKLQPELHKMPSGTETILLAEDEDGVRELAALTLRSCGYKVLESRSGQGALDVCLRHEGAIDLLMTDVIMPKMSGRQLADLITARRPGMRVLYLSGYTDDALIHHGVEQGKMPFLQKPCSPMTLARKVREVLDNSGR